VFIFGLVSDEHTILPVVLYGCERRTDLVNVRYEAQSTIFAPNGHEMTEQS